MAASYTVVAGNISITLQYAYALFYSSVTHAFISIEFVKKLDVQPESFECELRINTPTSDLLIANQVFKRCMLQIDNVEMFVDMVELNIRDFIVIIGMKWLYIYS